MSNPNDEVCPDYLQPEFAEARLIFTVEGKSEEEAAIFLETIWQFNNARDIVRWDNQCEAEAEAERLAKVNETREEERQRILHEQEADTARQEERKKYKNKFVPIPNKPLSAIVLLLPPQHALNKLHKGEYIPLHYFTNKGIREAEEDTAATEDNILTLVQSETGPIFQSAATVKAKECKVKDEHLTWEEFSQANYRMLNAMRQQDWLEERVIMVRDFWLALESHEWRHNPSEFRKRALLVYQGKIRRDWHKTIGTPDSFSLLPLEQERLRAFHQELLDNAYVSKIESLNAFRERGTPQSSYPSNAHKPLHTRSSSLSKRPISPSRDSSDAFVTKKLRTFRADPGTGPAISEPSSFPSILPVCAVCLGRQKHTMPVIRCPAK